MISNGGISRNGAQRSDRLYALVVRSLNLMEET